MRIQVAPLLLLALIPAQAEARSGPMDTFDHADANGDGRITLAEFKAARDREFSRFDRNGDGVVSQADIGMIAQFRPDIAQRFNAFIARADANHDGRVTRSEFSSAPAPIFERADTNHDGAVDRAELAALREAMNEKR